MSDDDELPPAFVRDIVFGGEKLDLRASDERIAENLLEPDLSAAREAAAMRYASYCADIPRTLHHYTDSAGLLGIIASRSIRATHARHLNDSAELDYVTDVLARVAIQTLPELVSDTSKELCQSLADGSYLVSFYGSIYVASFSTEPDVLSQWRAYSRDGAGYAIGFSGARLPSAGGDWPAPRLMRVLYEIDEQDAVIAPFLSDSLRALDNLATQDPGLADGARRVVSQSIDAYVTRFLPALKNPGFREEKEWRLVVWNHRPGYREPIGFRASPFGLTPYLELKWGNLLPPLSTLRLGPALNSDESLEAAEQFLHASQYKVKSLVENTFEQGLLTDAETVVLASSNISYRPSGRAHGL